MQPSGGPIWAALSGGVDSATAAALLVEQGFQVQAVFMELWDCGLVERGGRVTCCSPKDRADAMEVAERLGVPFRSVDLRKPFRDLVIREFVDSYVAGHTPNPCIRCNQWIKYGVLLEMALKAGAQGLATGHYARVVRARETETFRLLRGEDPSKDQSYFLFPLGQRELRKVVWPLGNMRKDSVRRLSAKWGLPVARKKESQEVCFIAGGDYREFVTFYLGKWSDSPGSIVDERGKTLGTHGGVLGFTVGQRKGLGIPWREPLYVLRLVPEEGLVVVGPKERTFSRGLEASHASWVAGEPPGECFRAHAQIRYRHRGALAEVQTMPGDRFRLTFHEPQPSIAPGQAVVLYRGEEVIGGGWIREALR